MQPRNHTLEFETDYKYLKAVIEGGLETRPDNVLIYGNPARVIRDLREDEIKALHQSAVDYYDIALKYLKENDVKGVQ